MVIQHGKNRAVGHFKMNHGCNPMLIMFNASQLDFNHHLHQVMRSLDTIFVSKVGFKLFSKKNRDFSKKTSNDS